ncbi:hypothetical protein BDZ89DRAFT_491442 [Hymenopellis radicata]|nr:hypothetical protein BDZ89DRAFT_491442 [Hymenopellis radicata]
MASHVGVRLDMSNTHYYVLRACLSRCCQWQDHLRRRYLIVLAVFSHIPVGSTAPLDDAIKSVYHHYDLRQTSNGTDNDDVRDVGLGTPWVSLIIAGLVLALFVVAVVLCRKYNRPRQQRTRASVAVQHPRPVQPEVVRQSIAIPPPPAYSRGALPQPPPYEYITAGR